MIKNKYAIFLFVGVTISDSFVAMDSIEQKEVEDLQICMQNELEMVKWREYQKGYEVGFNAAQKELSTIPQATIPKAELVFKIDQSESLPAVLNSVDEDIFIMHFMKGFKAGLCFGVGLGLTSLVVYKCMEK